MTSTITPTTPAGSGARVPSDLDAAREMGRELARELAVPLGSAQLGVEQMVRAGIPRLAHLGIRAEVVRSRLNCVVVRSAPGPAETECGCALITAWLESLPRVAFRALGTVVESSCTTRGGTSCIHTLLWQIPGAATAAPVPRHSTVEAPAANGCAAASSTTTGSAPTTPSAAALTPNGATEPPARFSRLPHDAGSHLGWAQASEGSSAPSADRQGLEADRRCGDRRAMPGGGPPTHGERRGRDRRAHPTRQDVADRDSWAERATLAFHGPFHGRSGASSAEMAVTEELPAVTWEAGAPNQADPLGAAGTPKTDELSAGSTAAKTPPAVTTASSAHDDMMAISEERVLQQPHSASLGARSREWAGSARRSSDRRGRWAWLRRRAWLVALGVIAGSGGAYLASAHHAPSYSATAVLVVRVGASPTGPGSANDALALAITDAALLPSDQSVVNQVASDLHLPVASVSHDIVAQAVAGTALLQVHFSAASPTTAVAGANDVAAAVTGPRPNDLAIANGSVAEVARAKTASSSSSLYKHALPLGAVLGLLLGIGMALAAERADRRIDEAQALHDAAGCPVTVVPGEISPVELSRAIKHAAGSGAVTLVPLRRTQFEAARQLARELGGAGGLGAGAAGDTDEQFRVTMPFADAPDAAGKREGPVVLVVGTGERMRVVHEVAGRLRLLGRAPLWSILFRPS